MQLIGGQNPYVETTLTIYNTALDLDKLQFRVVFTVDGKEYDTNSAKTEGFARASSCEGAPISDITAAGRCSMEGGTASFQSEFVYYKSLNDKITVEWQFRGSSNSSWEKVEGSFIERYQISKSVTASNVPYAGYKVFPLLSCRQRATITDTSSGQCTNMLTSEEPLQLTAYQRQEKRANCPCFRSCCDVTPTPKA